jgi:hypothetical protein
VDEKVELHDVGAQLVDKLVEGGQLQLLGALRVVAGRG